MPEESDGISRDLLMAALNGDEQATTQLLLHVQDWMEARLARSGSYSREDSEELARDVMAAVLKKLPVFVPRYEGNPVACFRALVNTILKAIAADYWRRVRPHDQLSEPDALVDTSAATEDFDLIDCVLQLEESKSDSQEILTAEPARVRQLLEANDPELADARNRSRLLIRLARESLKRIRARGDLKDIDRKILIEMVQPSLVGGDQNQAQVADRLDLSRVVVRKRVERVRRKALTETADLAESWGLSREYVTAFFNPKRKRDVR